MPDFDPYHKWLGISPQHQPPNHYRLLSLDVYESDPEVIEAAVDRIVAFLQDVASGPQAGASQQLLNEVAAARLCLLDGAQKAAYDEQLAAELTTHSARSPDGPVEPPPPPPAAPAIVIDTGANRLVKPSRVPPIITEQPQVQAAANRSASVASEKKIRRKQHASLLLLLSFLSGGGLLILALVLVLLADGDSESKHQAAEQDRVRERLESFAEMGRQAESAIPDFQPQLDYQPPPPKKAPAKKAKKKPKQK